MNSKIYRNMDTTIENEYGIYHVCFDLEETAREREIIRIHKIELNYFGKNVDITANVLWDRGHRGLAHLSEIELLRSLEDRDFTEEPELMEYGDPQIF